MTATVAELMPKVSLGPHAVSRLIVGGNPFSGNSHQSSVLDAEMRHYYTGHRVLETLHRCQKWGVNAFQSRGDNHMMRLVNDYHLAGGRLLWIAESASERADMRANVSQIVRAGAVAIYHHGARTDRLWQQGDIAVVREDLKPIRDTGALVGLGTHIPAVISHAEDENWDLDFYMASLYNPTALAPAGSPAATAGTSSDQFLGRDRELMTKTIRLTRKPVLAFKVLAAGRLSRTREALASALRYAFSNIKPTDAVVVGIFTKYGDQVAQDALLAMELGQPQS